MLGIPGCNRPMGEGLWQAMKVHPQYWFDLAAGADDSLRPILEEQSRREARAGGRPGLAPTIKTHRYQSAVVLGIRGACRVGAREASAGAAANDVFRQRFAGVGTLRYAYRSRIYDELGRIRLFLDRTVPRTLDRLTATSVLLINEPGAFRSSHATLSRGKHLYDLCPLHICDHVRDGPPFHAVEVDQMQILA